MKSKDLTPINYYLELGKFGVFPFFEKEFITKNSPLRDKKIKGDPKKILTKFFKKLDKQKNLNRKQVIVNAMSENDKKVFLQAYFHVLEEKILNDEHKYH